MDLLFLVQAFGQCHPPSATLTILYVWGRSGLLWQQRSGVSCIKCTLPNCCFTIKSLLEKDHTITCPLGPLSSCLASLLLCFIAYVYRPHKEGFYILPENQETIKIHLKCVLALERQEYICKIVVFCTTA